MVDVFLSYKREDRPRVDRLATCLADLDIDAWYDVSLRAGDDWQARIEEIARAAKAIVVCLSEAALASEWVAREMKIAQQRRVLVPLRFSPCQLPPELDRLHCADLTDWAGETAHRGVAQLVDGLERFLQRGLPARLEERVGGQNPAAVQALRQLLVRIARTQSPPITYEQAHAAICGHWPQGSQTPMTALFGALDAIADQNRARREPPLFGLVVGGSGIPGRGYFQKHCFLAGGYSAEARQLHSAQLKRVYGSSWPHDPPEPGPLLTLMEK